MSINEGSAWYEEKWNIIGTTYDVQSDLNMANVFIELASKWKLR